MLVAGADGQELSGGCIGLASAVVAPARDGVVCAYSTRVARAGADHQVCPGWRVRFTVLVVAPAGDGVVCAYSAGVASARADD